MIGIAGNIRVFVMRLIFGVLMNKNVLLVLAALLMADLASAKQELSWKGDGFYINGVVVEKNKFKGGLRDAVKGARVSVLNALPASSRNYLVYVSRPTRQLPLNRCGERYGRGIDSAKL